jgi:CPA2 family monovalent cation:H+ antiporter-2
MSVFFSGDEICVIGSDAQVKEFDNYLHQHEFELQTLRKLKLYCNNSS